MANVTNSVCTADSGTGAPSPDTIIPLVLGRVDDYDGDDAAVLHR
jgi:hypothetical protein